MSESHSSWRIKRCLCYVNQSVKRRPLEAGCAASYPMFIFLFRHNYLSETYLTNMKHYNISYSVMLMLIISSKVNFDMATARGVIIFTLGIYL